MWPTALEFFEKAHLQLCLRLSSTALLSLSLRACARRSGLQGLGRQAALDIDRIRQMAAGDPIVERLLLNHTFI
eukprot:6196047-Pleurochrysis_carterae.AAC.2